MDDERTRFQIGEFAELVGLSIPQLRRFDRLQLLKPAGRSDAGYRYYIPGQTGTARVIALLRSLDMPIADIRRILIGIDEQERQDLIVAHRARLETRLEEVLGLRLAWRTTDGTLAAIASGDIERFLLVPWTGTSPIQPRTAYIYVEDPDALCAEYQLAGADIVQPVQSRPYGMRDFEVRDPDGHCFTLGTGEETLRDVAGDYGLEPNEIVINRDWSYKQL